jgi:hypothetical protein
MDSNFIYRAASSYISKPPEEDDAVNTREGLAKLELELAVIWRALGVARGYADAMGKLTLCDELGHMQEVIFDYQVQLTRTRSLRTRPKENLKCPPLPNL